MKNFSFLIFCITLIGCESDPLDAGIVTNIQGTVSDNWNMIPFVDLKLKVAEYKRRPAGIYTSYEFIKWIDSTYTDTNGYYDLNFETSLSY